MRRSRQVLAGAAVVLTAALTISSASSVLAASSGQTLSNTTDAPSTGGGVDTGVALVQLVGDPLSISPRTHPAQGKKIDFTSNSVKSERAQLSALRNDFKAWLRTNAPNAKVTSEYDISLNAVAVNLNGEKAVLRSMAPRLGEHTDEVLRDAGYAEREIVALRAARTIG